MLRLENVATPPTALTVSVPPKVPLDGFVPIAIVTGFVADVMGLPAMSSIVTTTAGVIDAPAVTFVGCTVNASFDAVPVVTVIVTELGGLTSPLLVTVSCTRYAPTMSATNVGLTILVLLSAAALPAGFDKMAQA